MSKITQLSSLFLFTIAGGVSSCAAEIPSDTQATAAESGDNSVESVHQAATVAPVQQYFSVTRDMRLCLTPKCGGYWVKALNQARTVCADKTTAASCYVAEIDYRALGGDPKLTSAYVVLKGTISLKSYPGVGSLGYFTALDAWGSATAVSPTGTYYRLSDTGIVCVTAPCYNISAEAVNLGTTVSLSSYDFRKVGATPEQLAAAQSALVDGRLIAAGTINSVITPTTPGRALSATQFYLPARDFCYSDSDCSKAELCNASTVCLPPPGCNPTTATCAAVCTGYCIPR